MSKGKIIEHDNVNMETSGECGSKRKNIEHDNPDMEKKPKVEHGEAPDQNKMQNTTKSDKE